MIDLAGKLKIDDDSRQHSMKGFTGLEILIIGAVITFVGSLFVVPGLASSLGSIVQNNVNSCEDTPYDGKCICSADQSKISAPGLKYTCTAKPPFVSSITKPIDTWEEAIAYTHQQVGTNVKCDGSNFYRVPTSGNVNAPSNIIVVECAETVGFGGQSLYIMNFYQNNGCIIKKFCNDQLASQNGFTCNSDYPADGNYDYGSNFITGSCPLG